VGRSGNLYAKNDHLVPEFLASPNYIIREDGHIFTNITVTGKVSVKNIWRIAGHIHDGYIEISFKGTKLRAHRIVYAKFKGSLSPDLVINHKDGLRGNNHPDNLEMDTQSHNNYHRYRSLKKPPVMGNRVLDWEKVRIIRELKKDSVPHRHIAARFGISKGHVSEIVNHRIWIEGKEYAPFEGAEEVYSSNHSQVP
jgi:replicative superfamily II helicase